LICLVGVMFVNVVYPSCPFGSGCKRSVRTTNSRPRISSCRGLDDGVSRVRTSTVQAAQDTRWAQGRRRASGGVAKQILHKFSSLLGAGVSTRGTRRERDIESAELDMCARHCLSMGTLGCEFGSRLSAAWAESSREC
jgi:hypothetical protein